MKYPLPLRGRGRVHLPTTLFAGLCWLMSLTASLPAAAQTQTQAPSEALDPSAATGFHRLVLCTDGTVKGWGSNSNGQLGSASTGGSVATPTTVALSLPSPIVQVVTSYNSSFALCTNGTVWAWGSNSNGQLGTGSTATSTATATQVTGVSQVVALAAGFQHTLALCADGTVWAWGSGGSGQLGNGSTSSANTPQHIAPSVLHDIRAVVCGDYFSLALDANGRVWSWGRNSDGALGTGAVNANVQSTPVQLSSLADVRYIEACETQAAALTSTGQVYDWGRNSSGELGLNHSNYTGSPALVGTFGSAVAVAMCGATTLVLNDDGSTVAWGFNNLGQFGTSSPTPYLSTVPTTGGQFSPNVQIFGTNGQFMSIERTGLVKTWGYAQTALGYTPTTPGTDGGSCVPTTPTGVCLAVPTASFPECGPQRAYYQRPGATYIAARHGYTVSPAEIGSFGQLTTIDASQLPYNGTVVFDGIYHLRGDVRFINGNFETRPGTVFYINGLSGRPTDSQRTSIAAEDGNLLLTSTELRAQCDELWQGLVLADGTQLRTQGSGKFQRVHSSIRDATAGVYNTGNGHYFLFATDFINNGVGVMDAPRTNVLVGEGVQSCRFLIDPAAGGPLMSLGYQYSGTGINFYDTSSSISQNYYGDFGNAIFSSNTFDNLVVGVGGTAGNATIQNSIFTNCWKAAAYSDGRPNSPEAVRFGLPTLPMVFSGNIIALPTNLPASYTTVANTTTYGIQAQVGHELRDNKFLLAPLSPGVASRRVGVALLYQGTAISNTFTGLTVGIEAKSGEWYMATNYDFESNTFTDNNEGVSFLAPGYSYNNPGSTTLRCNTFSSTVSGATGVWVKAGTVFPAALGSASAPNGNRFDGIATANKRFVYDASGPFQYYRYNSAQEYFGGTTPPSAGNLLYDSGGNQLIVATVPQPSASGTGACGTSSSTPGVYARSTAPVKSPVAPSSNSSSESYQLNAGYPNPASETVIFTYSILATSHPVVLVLRDLLGQEVARYLLSYTAGEVRMPVQHLAAGFYTASIEIAGMRMCSQKLSVVH